MACLHGAQEFRATKHFIVSLKCQNIRNLFIHKRTRINVYTLDTKIHKPTHTHTKKKNTYTHTQKRTPVHNTNLVNSISLQTFLSRHLKLM